MKLLWRKGFEKLHQKSQELTNIYNSKSWKMTKKINNILNKIKIKKQNKKEH